MKTQKRNEIKFILNNIPIQTLVYFLKASNGLFSEEFPGRFINSIYFDNLNFDFYKNAYLLKPNLKEFEDIVGKCPNKKVFNEEGEKLRKKLDLEYLLITQGKDGMTLFENGKVSSYASNQQDVFDVTGAGDTVISILAAYLIAEENITTAVEMSNIAAGISIKKLGSTSVTQKELNNASRK